MTNVDKLSVTRIRSAAAGRRRNAIRATATAMIMAAPTASMTPVELPVTGRIAVHKGEVVTLVDSNSADKTTTLRAISGTSRLRAESSSSRASRC
jgi:ABC-type hemin transport system ATPase subunit